MGMSSRVTAAASHSGGQGGVRGDAVSVAVLEGVETSGGAGGA